MLSLQMKQELVDERAAELAERCGCNFVAYHYPVAQVQIDLEELRELKEEHVQSYRGSRRTELG